MSDLGAGSMYYKVGVTFIAGFLCYKAREVV